LPSLSPSLPAVMMSLNEKVGFSYEDCLRVEMEGGREGGKEEWEVVVFLLMNTKRVKRKKKREEGKEGGGERS